jgi:hypothetical protein
MSNSIIALEQLRIKLEEELERATNAAPGDDSSLRAGYLNGLQKALTLLASEENPE